MWSNLQANHAGQHGGWPIHCKPQESVECHSCTQACQLLICQPSMWFPSTGNAMQMPVIASSSHTSSSIYAHHRCTPKQAWVCCLQILTILSHSRKAQRSLLRSESTSLLHCRHDRRGCQQTWSLGCPHLQYLRERAPFVALL